MLYTDIQIDKQGARVIMGTFVEFGGNFWQAVFALVGVTFTMRDIVKSVPASAGVTPFRVFSVNGNRIVLVEPTHSDGAYVQKFDTTEAYTKWYDAHMHIDIANRDM